MYKNIDNSYLVYRYSHVYHNAQCPAKFENKSLYGPVKTEMTEYCIVWKFLLFNMR